MSAAGQNRLFDQMVESPMGMNSMKRTSTGQSMAMAARAGSSLSLTPRMATAFILSGMPSSSILCMLSSTVGSTSLPVMDAYLARSSESRDRLTDTPSSLSVSSAGASRVPFEVSLSAVCGKRR